MTVSNVVPPSLVPQNLRYPGNATANPGQWESDTDQGIEFDYQWQRCDSAGGSCADIAGATGIVYPLSAADVGNRVRVRVHATEVDPTPPPDPDPPVSPFWAADFADGNYVPLSTIFEAYGTDSHVKNWGGLEAPLYDTTIGDNAIRMAIDPAQRVSLRTSPAGPHGSAYVSRQELKASDPAWYPGAGAGYDKASIRNLLADIFPEGFSMGLERWVAWDYYLPLNGPGGDTFNWDVSGSNPFHTIMDLHESVSTPNQTWNALNIGAIRPTTNASASVGADIQTTGNVSGSDYRRIEYLPLSDAGGSRVAGSYNVWHELVVGVKFSDQGHVGSSPGWLEIWHDGVNVMPRQSRPTCLAGSHGVWMQAQNYKNHGGALSFGASRSVIYFGGLRVGLAKADVSYS